MKFILGSSECIIYLLEWQKLSRQEKILERKVFSNEYFPKLYNNLKGKEVSPSYKVENQVTVLVLPNSVVEPEVG